MIPSRSLPRGLAVASDDTLLCTRCGTKNPVEEKGTSGALKACRKCKKQVVTITALLADLRLIAAEVGECPKCKHLQVAEHVYCFSCGKEWRKK